MKVFEELIQGTDEWLEVRSGVISASEVGAWVAKEKRTKTDEKAALNLICLKLAEKSGEEMQPFYETWAVKRGNALEPEARKAYELESGNEVEEVGFVMHDNNMMGVSPDGLTRNRKSGVELKCPLPQTHVKYLLDGVLPEQYKPQVHMQMAICEWEFCDFYSYSPSLPPFMLRVERDDFTEAMLSGLLRFCYEYKMKNAVMAVKWDEMKKRIEANEK